MKKVLLITANPKSLEESTSKKVAQAFVDAYKINNPSDEVKELDLFDLEIPSLDKELLPYWQLLENVGEKYADVPAHISRRLLMTNRVCEEFCLADKYIFVAPNWESFAPAKLVAYINAVMHAGRTFRYTENGVEGLLLNKKAVFIYSSGGVCDNPETLGYSFAVSWLKSVMAVNGVTDFSTVLVQGGDSEPDHKPQIIEEAINEAKNLAAKF